MSLNVISLGLCCVASPMIAPSISKKYTTTLSEKRRKTGRKIGHTTRKWKFSENSQNLSWMGSRFSFPLHLMFLYHTTCRKLSASREEKIQFWCTTAKLLSYGEELKMILFFWVVWQDQHLKASRMWQNLMIVICNENERQIGKTTKK